MNSWFRWWSGLLALFSGSTRGFPHVPLQHLPSTSRSALAQGSWRENVTLTSHQQSVSIMLAWLFTIWAGSDRNKRWKGETGLVCTWTNELKHNLIYHGFIQQRPAYLPNHNGTAQQNSIQIQFNNSFLQKCTEDRCLTWDVIHRSIWNSCHVWAQVRHLFASWKWAGIKPSKHPVPERKELQMTASY